jgi:hypothetical protein
MNQTATDLLALLGAGGSIAATQFDLSSAAHFAARNFFCVASIRLEIVR